MDFRYKTIFKTLGLMLLISGIAMIPSLLYAAITNDTDTERAFIATAGVSIIIGGMMRFFIPRSERAFRTRDGYLSLLLCWVMCSLVGALPYLLSGQITSISSAIFESTAGYTTTSASAVPDTVLTGALVLWKATMHWIGGLGIVVFTISILPSFGTGSQRIAAAEAPGTGMYRTSARTFDISKMLVISYTAMTLCEFLMLLLGSSMGPYDALVNSLGSISTAGLLLHQGSISYYSSLYVELVIACFTLLASVNFLMYIYAIKGTWSEIKRNLELKTYFCVIAVCTLLVTVDLWGTGTFSSLGSSLRYAFFQVCSFSSTSGFSIGDYNYWPAFSQMLLFIIVLGGGCIGSTSGGIKIIRCIIMSKLVFRGFYRRVHSRSVRAIKIGDRAISGKMVSGITSFALLFLGIFVGTAVVLSLQGLDMSSTLSAAASLLTTMGSGFGVIGPSGDYSMFCAPLKLFMSLIMIVGRLELFSVFLLFMPEFWDPNKAKLR